MLEIGVVGFAIFFNAAILRYKYKKKRYNDLAIDIIVLAVLNWAFAGTILGMGAAMLGGMLVSIYLLFDGDLDGNPKDKGITYQPRHKDLNLKW